MFHKEALVDKGTRTLVALIDPCKRNPLERNPILIMKAPILLA